MRIIKTARYTITISVEQYDGQLMDWLGEMFTPVDKHEGGVTITTPCNRGDDRYHQFYIPTQYTLASLASDYAAQGRSNPSGEAYASAQRELGWYITAGDYGISVTVEKAGVMLADVNAGFSFDYSWEYSDQTLEDYTISNFSDVIRETVREAIAEARETIKEIAL